MLAHQTRCPQPLEPPPRQPPAWAWHQQQTIRQLVDNSLHWARCRPHVQLACLCTSPAARITMTALCLTIMPASQPVQTHSIQICHRGGKHAPCWLQRTCCSQPRLQLACLCTLPVVKRATMITALRCTGLTRRTAASLAVRVASAHPSGSMGVGQQHLSAGSPSQTAQSHSIQVS